MARRAERFIILGNPENRRVSMFAQAVEREGLPAPLVVAWADFLRGAPLPDVDQACFRLESFGENFEVAKLLLHRGGFAGEVVERKGEVLAPAVAHRGFEDALGAVKAMTPSRWQVLSHPDDVAELFDKRRTSRRFAAHGVPVPEPLDEVPVAPEALVAEVRRRGWTEAFVKLSCGSSASCVLHLAVAKAGVRVTTSLEWDAPRWFNTLKVRRYVAPADVDRALAFVLSQGAQVERGLAKARLDGEWFDLRVLCIGGEPAFVVVRQSRLPITNLHLGGHRGDVGALLRQVPVEAWEAAMASCRTVAGLYRCLHVGIDLMFEPDFQGHRVLEANAFGDLFPHLTRGGVGVYEWEIRVAVGLPVPTEPFHACLT